MTATRPIKRGQEIFTNYGYTEDSSVPEWYEKVYREETGKEWYSQAADDQDGNSQADQNENYDQEGTEYPEYDQDYFQDDGQNEDYDYPSYEEYAY